QLYQGKIENLEKSRSKLLNFNIMKTKILKMVLPAFVLMLAIFGAFAFKSAGDKALLLPETGWINLPGQPCLTTVQCDTTPSDFVCEVFHNGELHQAFGKTSEEPPICNKTLYRPMQSQ